MILDVKNLFAAASTFAASLPVIVILTASTLIASRSIIGIPAPVLQFSQVETQNCSEYEIENVYLQLLLLLYNLLIYLLFFIVYLSPSQLLLLR